MYFGRFLEACQAVYQAPQVEAGPDGRDGASLIEAEDCNILAFRGTVSSGSTWLIVEDWLNDLHANQVKDDRFPGGIHAGFLSSITALWPAITAKAEEVNEDKPLVCTGHSKGGALAILAGWLLRDIQPFVVTFGAPKVGDDTFARAYLVPTFRFESPEDRVPCLPPWAYMSCGMRVCAPRWFVPPSGLIENHLLETGYKPWII